MRAPYHPNGPTSSVLQRSCDTFWNADTGPPGAPWTLAIELGEELEVSGFQYVIYQQGEAPKAFTLAASTAQHPTPHTVLSTTATNEGCSSGTPVNVSASDSDVLAFHIEQSPSGVSTFALCYGGKGDEQAAVACAQAAVTEDAAAIMAQRNEYIGHLQPLQDPSDDRLQRKLLSVMKVPPSLAPLRVSDSEFGQGE